MFELDQHDRRRLWAPSSGGKSSSNGPATDSCRCNRRPRSSGRNINEQTPRELAEYPENVFKAQADFFPRLKYQFDQPCSVTYGSQSPFQLIQEGSFLGTLFVLGNLLIERALKFEDKLELEGLGLVLALADNGVGRTG